MLVKCYLSLLPPPSTTSSAFSLGNQGHFNKQFKREDERYTYLVPSDSAWDRLNAEFATAHKQLFMGEYAYHVGIGRKADARDTNTETLIVFFRAPPSWRVISAWARP